jgi:outer membrane protein assembly factor BamB
MRRSGQIFVLIASLAPGCTSLDNARSEEEACSAPCVPLGLVSDGEHLICVAGPDRVSQRITEVDPRTGSITRARAFQETLWNVLTLTATTGLLVGTRPTLRLLDREWNTRWTFDVRPSGAFALAMSREIVLLGGPRATIALSVRDGRVLWTKELGAFRAHIEGHQAYLLVRGKGIYAVNAADGRQIWSYTDSNLDSAILVSGDLVIAQAGKNLVAVRRADGRVAWMIRIQDRPWSLVSDRERLYFLAPNEARASRPVGTLGAISLKTGELIWKDLDTSLAPQDLALHGSIILAKEAGPDEKQSAFSGSELKIFGIDGTTGKVLWSRPYPRSAALFDTQAGSNLAHGWDQSNGLFTMNAQSGELLWRHSAFCPPR